MTIISERFKVVVVVVVTVTGILAKKPLQYMTLVILSRNVETGDNGNRWTELQTSCIRQIPTITVSKVIN